MLQGPLPDRRARLSRERHRMSNTSHDLDVPTIRATSKQGALPACGKLPRRFGNYELQNEIGRGGMGVIFRAKQLDLSRIVAIKMIIDEDVASEDEIQRFQAEAEAAANLDHPGIVPIYEVGQHDNRRFFSMAYIDGRSLAQELSQGPLPATQAALLLSEVADAIQFAHNQGVIHRDLKPANVLIDSAGRPRVTDFGVAKRNFADKGLTMKGELLGTPSYMPPEQARGEPQITPAADVYSLGAILYSAVTGRPPFQSANQLDTLMQVIEDDVIPPRQLNSKVPLDLQTITLKCLSKEPSRRYQTAQEVADDLRAFLAGNPIKARPPQILERGIAWVKQHLLVASMSGLTSVALVTVLAVLAWRYRVEQNRADGLETQVSEYESMLGVADGKASLSLRHCKEIETLWRTADDRRLALEAEKWKTEDRSLALLLAAEGFESLYITDASIPSQSREVLIRLIADASDEPTAQLEQQSLSSLVETSRAQAGRELTEVEIAKFLIQHE